MKGSFVCLHVLNPQLEWAGRGLTNPSQTIQQPSTWSSVFVYVCVQQDHVSLCEATVWFFLWLLSETEVKPGYGGIVPPLFLVQSPVCVWGRVWHLPQILVLAAERPLLREAAKNCNNQLIVTQLISVGLFSWDYWSLSLSGVFYLLIYGW